MSPSALPFRYVPGRRGAYSVWRGDQQLGHVSKRVLYVDHFGQHTKYVRWEASLPFPDHQTVITRVESRDAAAWALWRHRT